MKNYQYILTHSSGNLTCEYNPLDWDIFNVIYRRSDMYHSVLRSQVIDVEFPFDGKAYLDSIYETYGIDTDIGCEIKYLDKSNMTYVTLYTGIIDLSEWVSQRDTTTVKVIDSSVMALFAARDEVEVPINRTEDLDGNTISSYTLLNNFTIDAVDIEEQIYMDYNTVTLVAINSTLNTVEVVEIEETDWDESNRELANSGATSFVARYQAFGEIVYDFTFPAAPPSTYSCTMTVSIDENGSLRAIATHTISDTEGTSHNGSFNGVIGFRNYTIPAGGYLGRMVFSVIGSAGTTGTWSVDNGYLRIFKVTEGLSATTESIPLVHEVGAKLLEIITGVADPLDAPMFGRTDSEPRTYGSDGDYSMLGIASGVNIRQYEFEDFPLVTTFANYFKSLDALFNLGLWYDGTEFSIAAKEDFYKVSKIITLGEVQGLEISVSMEHYFNSIIAGYQDELTFDEVNGNQNGNVNYKLSNDSRISNTLDISSPYHGDDYGIEIARNVSDRGNYSSDKEEDDNIYILYGERSGGDYRTILSDTFNSVTGVYSSDTRLNLHITPKRNILRHGNQLSIPLFKSLADTSYATKQFELDLATQIDPGDPVITEKDDIPYSELEEPLFYPEVYNFVAPLSNANILQLQSDPHGYVEFDHLGVTYSGYILEVSTEPFNRRGNWTLIRRNPNRT